MQYGWHWQMIERKVLAEDISFGSRLRIKQNALDDFFLSTVISQKDKVLIFFKESVITKERFYRALFLNQIQWGDQRFCRHLWCWWLPVRYVGLCNEHNFNWCSVVVHSWQLCNCPFLEMLSAYYSVCLILIFTQIS